MKLLTSLFLTIAFPLCSLAGVSGGGVGTRPGMGTFAIEPGAELSARGVSGGGVRSIGLVKQSSAEYESVKAISAYHGEVTFSYKKAAHSVPETYKLRAEEFSAGQEKYLAAVRESLGSKDWVAIK